MSRLGRKPVKIPAGVEVKVSGPQITVKGKLGTLTQVLPEAITAEVGGDSIHLKAGDLTKALKAQYGLARATLHNLIVGVSDGFTMVLELNGPGYKAAVQGNVLLVSVGYSRPIEFKVEKDLQVSVKGNQITIFGVNKAKVGEVAAEIRQLREVEPYKERGIKYAAEKIRRKVSKAAKV
ncbi:MAG: 50S ribosomal protein L6 [bacterium]